MCNQFLQNNNFTGGPTIRDEKKKQRRKRFHHI